MKKYQKNPPFLVFDFTKSHLYNQDSSIHHLMDANASTYWIKENESPAEKSDISLELRLTHYYKDGFQVRKFQKLVILLCEDRKKKYVYPKEIKVKLMQREAINVDKELRLPKESVLQTWSLQVKDSSRLELPLSLNIRESNTYPQNIFILGVTLDMIAPDSGKPCLKEIFLVE
ncbi:MAG: hypothetical protein AAF518_18505 [Spirochaetota bacterium]